MWIDTKMMVIKKYHAKFNYNGLIQKLWVHALKPHCKFDYNDIFKIIHMRRMN